jgi:toxin ParE1/3/4
VKRRAVEFSDDARADLLALYDWIAGTTSPAIALSYIERLENYILGFDLASERGHLREDIRAGLRIVGFERRITIAFFVEDERVVILRVFYGGQNWTDLMQ